jgi:hypothetical protein
VTPVELAAVCLVCLGVGAVWDLINPNALKVEWNSGGRLLLSFINAAAGLWLVLLLVGASVAASVAVVLGVLVLALLKILIHDR